MSTKTIVRYTPPNPVIGGREISPKDFESLGIFTQTTKLFWARETNFWLDVETAEISAEALEWLNSQPEFTVEEQEVPDPPAPAAPEVVDNTAPEGGQSKSTSQTTAGAANTTQSTKA